MISNLDQREVFLNGLALVEEKLGYSLQHAKVTQSTVRTEASMTTTQNQYQFQIINTQTGNANATRVNNVFINLQDVFLVSSVFVGWTSAAATDGAGKIYSYPNPVVTPAAAAPLNSLYNGILQIVNNNEVVVKNWDVQRHLFVPRTQQNTNFNVAAPTSPAVYTTDQINGTEDGWYPVEPGWVLNGAGQYVVTINLPAPISTIPTNGAIVLMFRGLLLQNVTTVK
jgi:hypothetical protein